MSDELVAEVAFAAEAGAIAVGGCLNLAGSSSVGSLCIQSCFVNGLYEQTAGTIGIVSTGGRKDWCWFLASAGAFAVKTSSALSRTQGQSLSVSPCEPIYKPFCSSDINRFLQYSELM